MTTGKVDASVDFLVTRLAPHPSLGRREQTKIRNRAVILAAARKVFGMLGYDAATVRDIVRASDLAVGTFYEYFRDKQEIFAAIAEEAWAGLRARLREVRRDRRLPLEERVTLAYLAYFRFVRDERVLYEVLDRMLWRSGRLSERPLALAVQELREDLVPDREAGALGEENPDLVAAAMVGTGLMVARRMLSAGEIDPEEAARFCTRFTLGGLTPASTSKTPRKRRIA